MKQRQVRRNTEIAVVASQTVVKPHSDCFLGIANDLDDTKDLPRGNLSSRNLGTPDDSSPRIQKYKKKSKGNDKTENAPFGAFENKKPLNASLTEESNSMRQLQQTSEESNDIFNQKTAAREKRKSNTSLHASLHTPSSSISSRGPLIERPKSDRFLYVTQRNVADRPLLSPLRVISPKGNRPHFQSAANLHKPAGEKKTLSKDKNQKKQKRSKKKSAALAPRKGLNSMPKAESILNFASDDWEGAIHHTSIELDPGKAESSISKSKSKPIDAQTANVQVTNVKALTRNETNQKATKPNQGRTAAPRWGSSAMEKAASIFNFGIDNWDSDSDSDTDPSAPDGGNQADALVADRKSDSTKPKSEKKVKNTKLPGKLAKIDEAKESNHKPASIRALGLRRTNSYKPVDSSGGNIITSTRIKVIPKSEIEQERQPENTEGMNSKKTKSPRASRWGVLRSANGFIRATKKKLTVEETLSSGMPQDKSYKAPDSEVGPMDNISPVIHGTKHTATTKRKSSSSRTSKAPHL
jgi:hypothetical protein